MKIKALVLMVYDRSWKRTRREWVAISEHVSRVVKDVELVKTVDGLPYKFDDEDQFEWAEKETWKLYRGKISYKRREVTVEAWTFGNHPPLYWGGSLENNWIGERNVLWNWLSVVDHSGYEFNYWNQQAYQRIRKHLGKDAFDVEWEDENENFGNG